MKSKAFYINLPIGAIFAPVYIFLLPNADSYAGMSLKGKFKMMDWTGTVVFLGGTACFTMAINFGGTAYSFNSGPEITLWTMTGVLLIAFALVTIYHPFVAAENKLYPSHFLKRPVLVNLQVQMFLVSGLSLVRAPTHLSSQIEAFSLLIKRRQRFITFPYSFNSLGYDFCPQQHYFIHSQTVGRWSTSSRCSAATAHCSSCCILYHQRRPHAKVWLFHPMVLFRKCYCPRWFIPDV